MLSSDDGAELLRLNFPSLFEAADRLPTDAVFSLVLNLLTNAAWSTSVWSYLTASQHVFVLLEMAFESGSFEVKSHAVPCYNVLIPHDNSALRLEMMMSPLFSSVLEIITLISQRQKEDVLKTISYGLLKGQARPELLMAFVDYLRNWQYVFEEMLEEETSRLIPDRCALILGYLEQQC
jgi:hypothetical protein